MPGIDTMPISAAVTFCDDIRTESNGKLILVGVYPENLVPFSIPQIITISVWIRIKGLKVGSHPVHFSAGVDDESRYDIDGTLNVPDGHSSTQFTVMGLQLEIKNYGKLFIKLTGFAENQTVYEELPIVPQSASTSA